ncbi:tRNA lysidine(34) synthetase TilS [Paenibacillus hamazuiensis]|uniref:tRNA lysidine(34) synthetase TilS n=1 Tax=Paenibacillus hamazuiensis TaxID=2936508 RepID=UPI00200E829D|nr:tRNA lysidine(34) synthetase TilS [Paenibacillus hamazuiensis]
MSLVDKVENFIRTEKLFERKDGIVVAVSGGPDSVALLHFLFLLSAKWEWALAVAHVNHRFRGEESDREADFVEALCSRMGVPCEIASIDLPQYIEETGKNSQLAAREKRYEFLHEVAGKYGASRIALAHHADDQAETVLMRVLRGTGLSGLSGMPLRRREKNVELVRPFLRIYKSEVLDYCAQHGIEYCEDSSNRETKYFRNRIRLELMPLLARYCDGLPESLNRLADITAAEDGFMDEQAQALLDRHVERTEGMFSFSRRWFGTLHLALQRRLIKLILSCLACEPDELQFSKVEQVRETVVSADRPNVRFTVIGTIFLTTEYDSAQLHTMVLPSDPYSYLIDPGTASVYIPEADATVQYEWLESTMALHGQKTTGRRNELFLDADEVDFPLVLRSRRQGDRIELLGLNGSKKVKDIFIDDKVRPSLREKIPILADAGGRILWIAGLRRSAHALVTEKTRRILYMKLTQAK